MIRKVYRPPHPLGVGARRHNAFSACTVAPFDTPSSILISVSERDGVNLEFNYDLGQNELARAETVGPCIVSFGQISGRVLRIHFPQPMATQMFGRVMDELRRRSEQQQPDRPGTPMRRAAHYDFVGGEVLPDLGTFIAEQLPQLRELTR